MCENSAENILIGERRSFSPGDQLPQHTSQKSHSGILFFFFFFLTKNLNAKEKKEREKQSVELF